MGIKISQLCNQLLFDEFLSSVRAFHIEIVDNHCYGISTSVLFDCLYWILFEHSLTHHLVIACVGLQVIDVCCFGHLHFKILSLHLDVFKKLIKRVLLLILIMLMKLVPVKDEIWLCLFCHFIKILIMDVLILVL